MEMTKEELMALTEDVKAVIKQLAEAGTSIKEIPNIIKASDEVKEKNLELENQIKDLQGTILEMGQKIVKLGDREVRVQPAGLSEEQKLDFAKYMVNLVKFADGRDAGSMQIVKDITDRYRTKANALQEGTDSEGGYGVPSPFSDAIWRAAAQASVAMQGALITPITRGYKMNIMSINTNVSVAWVSEEGSSTQTDITLSQSTVSAAKMLGHVIISNELLEDEEIGLIDLLITLIGEAVGTEIDNQAFNGDGTVFTGILNASGVNTETMTAGLGFSSVSFANISNAIAAVKTSVKGGAKFFMERTIINYFRKATDDNGQYIYSPPAGNMPQQIWGYPVQEVEVMPDSGDTAWSTPFIAFGNLKNLQIGTRGDMTIRLTDILRLLTDQTVLVFRKRIAIAVGLAEAFCLIKTGASS